MTRKYFVCGGWLRAFAASLIIGTAFALLAAASAASQNPNSPSGVTAGPAGQAEATISWTTPFQSETCFEITDYLVRVYNPSDGSDTAEVFTMNTSHTVGGLNPDTEYMVNVWTYWASCDEYSLSPASTTIATAGVASEGGPFQSSTPLLSPRPPSDVQVAVNSYTAEVSWTAPVDDATHCDVVDYTVVVSNLTDGSADDIQVDYITATSTSVSGLAPGSDYRVYVWAYSGECDAWSLAGGSTFSNWRSTG